MQSVTDRQTDDISMLKADQSAKNAHLLPVMLVLGLGLGLVAQDSVGQMLSVYTPVSITYTTALQV